MRAQLGKADVGTSITLDLDNEMTVRVSGDGRIEVRTRDGDSRFGYFFDLPGIDTVAEACNAAYTDDEQMYGGHGELTGVITVYHHH